jgi:DNA-binding MurR/RpiR family transcriptional regulator
VTSLVKIRAERDQMSAIERRIADFLLDNAHLLRDYSSQQLADALGISQSSVVKFSQKLGFKGYPDLKFSIGEALARNGAESDAQPVRAAAQAAHPELAAELWSAKSRSEEETRLINPRPQIDAIVDTVAGAGRIFLAGMGEDGVRAQEFALKLALLGLPTVQHGDPLLMNACLSSAVAGDVLLAFCEHGKQVELCHLARDFRARHGQVVSITRHTANPLRAHADACLLVSAHDERPWIEPLLYHSASQHLLDGVFVLLCESSPDLAARLQANLERARHLLQP